MPSSALGMRYELVTHEETFGAVTLKVTSIADLERSIDQMFAVLEKSGQTEILAEVCPYFGSLWPGARALCDYLTSLPRSAVTGKRILEVGCGLAVPSMLACSLGASVLATDCHPDVPRFLEHNLRQNDISGLQYLAGDWRTNEILHGPFDWIVGSDVLYDADHAVRLSKFIHTHAHPSTRIVITDPGRPYLQDFFEAMKQLGYLDTTTVLTVAQGQGHEKKSTKDVFVVEMARLR